MNREFKTGDRVIVTQFPELFFLGTVIGREVFTSDTEIECVATDELPSRRPHDEYPVVGSRLLIEIDDLDDELVDALPHSLRQWYGRAMMRPVTYPWCEPRSLLSADDTSVESALLCFHAAANHALLDTLSKAAAEACPRDGHRDAAERKLWEREWVYRTLVEMSKREEATP